MSLHTFMAHCLGRSRAASRAQVDRSATRVLQRLRQEPMWTSDAPLFDTAPTHVRRFSRAAAAAVAAAALVAVASGALVVRDVAGRRSLVAVVEAGVQAGESSLSLFSDGWTRPLQANERVAFGNIVRSNGGAGGILRLADGSRVEVRSHSELTLERAADGVRIRLNHGGLLVNAAKQRDGHLYVQTKDFTVSVVGTVFLVNAEEAGSRVAVLEGEVRVQQGATDQKLLPGQQVATSPQMTAPPLPQEIAWSRNAPAHLALLQQSAATGPQPGSARPSAPLASSAEPRLPVEEANPSAQAPAAGGSQQSRFLQVDVVSVDATVRDSSGQPVLDLRASDFKVLENGVEQTVESFSLVNTNAAFYYLLSYRSTAAPDGRFRRISVRVDRPGVRVESRTGYYGRDGFSAGAHAEDEADLVAPVLRERYEPSYPSDAILRRIQGSVVVEAVVDVDGRVSRSRVVSSLDKTFGLDDEALKAVSQWTFTPGELKDQKVPVVMRLVVTFRLH